MSSCGRPGHPFGKNSGESGPELRMQLLLQHDQCALAAPPGNDQEFLFLCRSKRSGLLRTKENDEGVAALLTPVGRVNRRLKDDSLCCLLLHGSEGRSSKVLVADASSAPVRSSATIRTVSANETHVEVVMSVSGATRAHLLFCNAVGMKPSPFVTEDFVGKASVTTALTTVARRLTLCCDRSEMRHFESALSFKAPAIVHA